MNCDEFRNTFTRRGAERGSRSFFRALVPWAMFVLLATFLWVNLHARCYSP